LPSNQVLGIGVDTIDTSNPQKFKEKYGLEKFILYTGRKDPQKNLPLLIDYYCKYIQKNGPKLDLVVTGPGEIEIPPKYKSHIQSLMLPKQDLYDGYSAALFTCQPSLNESFSFSIMESWLCNTPVLVHENCTVTKDHCVTSNGGLYFSNFDNFEGCVDYFLENENERKLLAQNGRNYTLNNFSWEKIVSKYVDFICNLFKN